MLDLPPAQVVCISQAIYHEARGESVLGQQAIGHVVLNRARNRHMTPCEVIREPGQFSFKLKRHYSGKAWKDAYKIAYYLNEKPDPSGGATYFHSTQTSPGWGFRLTTRIGHHLFYKDEKRKKH